MNWHYVAVKVKEDFGDGYEYVVGEAFPDLQVADVIPYAETKQLFGKTPEDLAKWLRQVADDIEKYGVVNDEQHKN
jgi:uncharacterized membrane protein